MARALRRGRLQRRTWASGPATSSGIIASVIASQPSASAGNEGSTAPTASSAGMSVTDIWPQTVERWKAAGSAAVSAKPATVSPASIGTGPSRSATCTCPSMAAARDI